MKVSISAPLKETRRDASRPGIAVSIIILMKKGPRREPKVDMTMNTGIINLNKKLRSVTEEEGRRGMVTTTGNQKNAELPFEMGIRNQPNEIIKSAWDSSCSIDGVTAADDEEDEDG